MAGSDIFRKLQKPTLERYVAGGAGSERRAGLNTYWNVRMPCVRLGWILAGVMAPATNNDNDRAPATATTDARSEAWNAGMRRLASCVV